VINPEQFVTSHMRGLSDFWHRREGACDLDLAYAAYGYDMIVHTNDGRVLDAARLSALRYSQSDHVDGRRAMTITVLVDAGLASEGLGDEWTQPPRYLASGPWMTIRALPHLFATGHMENWSVLAIISPALAAQPRLLSRHLFDTMTLNMIMWDGLGLVHASCLVKDNTALLLGAPHNTGKSTTALILALNGYRLLCDGMTYVRVTSNGLELLGYPVGEAKLRQDVVDLFPGLANGETTLVREDIKTIVDLRQMLPDGMTDLSLIPERVILCHLERGEGESTAIEPADPVALLEVMWPESSFVDEPHIMRSNAQALGELLSTAEVYRARLGTAIPEIRLAFDRLLAGERQELA